MRDMLVIFPQIRPHIFHLNISKYFTKYSLTTKKYVGPFVGSYCLVPGRQLSLS